MENKKRLMFISLILVLCSFIIINSVSATILDDIGDIFKSGLETITGRATTQSTTVSVLVSINEVPTTPVPRINSTEIGGNYTNATIVCSFDCSDTDTEAAIYYNISWLLNNISQFILPALTCTDDDGVAATLHARNTTVTSNWSCQVEVCDDEMSCSTKINSSHVIIRNVPPKINNVTNITFSWDNVGASESQNNSILFSFIAVDLDGEYETFNQLKNSTAKANITHSTNRTMFQFNNSCHADTAIGNAQVNYSCNISFQFWNTLGLWDLSVEIQDSNGSYAMNSTVQVTRASLLAAKFYPSSINWSTPIAPGASNQTTTQDPIRVNNTGNDPIGANSVRVDAIELRASGLSNETMIGADNFSASSVTGSNTECDVSASATTVKLVNDTATEVPGSAVQAGPGEEDQIYFCLFYVPSILMETPYNTTDGGVWTIDVV